MYQTIDLSLPSVTGCGNSEGFVLCLGKFNWLHAVGSHKQLPIADGPGLIYQPFSCLIYDELMKLCTTGYIWPLEVVYVVQTYNS